MGGTKQSKLFTVTPNTKVHEFNTALKRLNRGMQDGVNMQDLVGKITITEDPLEYQRRIRAEWDEQSIPTPKRKGGKKSKKP